MSDQAEPFGRNQLGRPDGRTGSLATGSGLCYMTSLIVIVGVVFAVELVPLHREHRGAKTRVDLLSAFAAWDGEWYVRITSAGYNYDPQRPSAVAFFPLYPSLAGSIVYLTGMRPEWALLLVSHAALVAVFVLLAAYVQQRFPTAGPDLAAWTLLAFGLFPTTFWFRMTYSESTFLLLAVLALYGMQRGWRPVLVAVVVGLATASRSVAVALVPVVAWYVWERGSGQETQVTRSSRLLSWMGRMVVLAPVCVWGLAAYMLYQWAAFGEPLAFVKTQVHWTERPVTFTDQIVGALTLEPIRAVYDSSSSCYWANVPPRGNLLFNLKAANPVYFLVSVGLVLLGWRKRWLNTRELLLAAGLLTIPYVMQGTRTGMSSQARYAAVVFPVYLVLGQLLSRCPAPLAAVLLAISGVFLAVYSALFVSWYWYY